MATSTIHVPAEENLGDLIEIRVDFGHPMSVATVAFPTATVVRTLARHGEIIREVFVKLLLDSFGKLSISEANGIIRNPKLELESSRFTFDLVPLSYESVDVIVGENWLLRNKAEMVCHEKVVKMPCVPKELVGFTPRRRIGFRMELVQGATPICEGSCRLTSLERQEVWNDCRSCKSKEEYESHVKIIVESLKEEKMHVRFSNNVEVEQRGSYLDVEGIKWDLKKLMIAIGGEEVIDCFEFDFEAKELPSGKGKCDVVLCGSVEEGHSDAQE
ncbi:hypothetical protein Tco_0500288 [Tanacetum coccineum]